MAAFPPPAWGALPWLVPTLACIRLPEETLPLSPAIDAEEVRYEMQERDPRTGLDQRLLPGVELGAARPVTLDMKWSSTFAYSFVPASVARAMGAQTIETVDLGALAPAVPAELEVTHGMNPSFQRVFEVVRIDIVDLGVGPTFGPVRALVLDDANSSFGLIGSDWSSFQCEKHGFRHVGAVADHPWGAVYWVEQKPKGR